MVHNAFAKRNREEMDAGMPALKLVHLPAGQVLQREEHILLMTSVCTISYNNYSTAIL